MLLKESDVYDIKKFDGTNLFWKNQMQDVLVQKKQKLPIMYLERTEQMNMTQFHWNELDELCKSTIRLQLAKSIYFFVLEWESACVEFSSVASHINDFDSFFVHIRAEGMNMDDEMKAIFLLCSLPPSWDIFCTAISNSAPNGTLVYNDVTSSLLSEEMRQKSMGSSHNSKAHYVKRYGKQRKSRAKQHDASKDGKRDSFHDKSSEGVECKPLPCGSENVEPIKDLQNNALEKKRIEKIIKENMENIKPIILHGESYHWEDMDIYNYYVKSLAAKQKWKWRKSSGFTSSTATLAVDGDLKEDEIDENHEQMDEIQ
ncbi:hypothetical protein L7F22_055499 [Adiantum nelumboides]|nr:hypothetical protein [Adiantum nelumboides]